MIVKGFIRRLFLGMTSLSLSSVLFIGVFLVVVTLIIVHLLLLVLSLFACLLIIVPEAPIQILIHAWAFIASLPSRTTTALLTTLTSHCISPASCCLPSIHLREEKTENCLTVGPVQIVKFNCDLLLWLCRCLLAFVVLLWEFAAGFDQGQEFGLLMALFSRKLLLKLPSFLLFDLLHGLEEELFDVRALVQDHLANRFQVRALLILLTDWLVEVLELLLLLVHDLLILELKQLTLFLEVGDDLSKTFFKEVNLGPQKLNLLVFLKLALGMLFHWHSLLL